MSGSSLCPFLEAVPHPRYESRALACVCVAVAIGAIPSVCGYIILSKIFGYFKGPTSPAGSTGTFGERQTRIKRIMGRRW